MSHPAIAAVTPLHAWGSDPSWLAMDASARGFHAQLMLVAVRQKPAGYLPDDDALWRRWLGLPPSWPARTDDGPSQDGGTDAMGKALRRFFEEPSRKGHGLAEGMLDALRTVWAPSANGTDDAALARGAYERWVDHLWITRWKPMVLTAWQRIDSDVVRLHPVLEGKEGGFWSPLAAALAGMHLSAPSAAHAPVAPPPFVESLTQKSVGGKAVKTGKARSGKSIEDPLPSPMQAPGVLGHGDVGALGMWWLNADTSPWRDLSKVVRHWRAPLSSERRRSLWDVGVACLAVDLADEKQARTFLGKLIRQYGEETVAKAVAELSMRALPPADGYSFLQGILRRETEGSEAEQKARHQRSRVAL